LTCAPQVVRLEPSQPKRGLPRSVLTVQLNDKDTGEPLCSCPPTCSARPGRAACRRGRAYLARRDSTVAAALAAPHQSGLHQGHRHPAAGLKEAPLLRLFAENAQKSRPGQTDAWIEGVVATDLPAALRDADVVSVAASRLKPLLVENNWFKDGSTILISGPSGRRGVLARKPGGPRQRPPARGVRRGGRGIPDKQASYDGVIGGRLPPHRRRKLPALADFIDIARSSTASRQARERPREDRIRCVWHVGLRPGLGYQLYKNALEKASHQAPSVGRAIPGVDTHGLTPVALGIRTEVQLERELSLSTFS